MAITKLTVTGKVIQDVPESGTRKGEYRGRKGTY